MSKMDWRTVLLPLLLAPAKIVSGANSKVVSSRIDLKLAIFHRLITRSPLNSFHLQWWTHPKPTIDDIMRSNRQSGLHACFG